MLLKRPCLICCKVTSGLEKPPVEKNGSAKLKHFFLLLLRYISGEGNHVGGEADQRQRQKERMLLLEKITNAGYPTCKDCSNIVESFSELYHQMKSIQLLLTWKVAELKEIMYRGQRSAKLSGSETEHLVIPDRIIKFKKELVEKCRRKLGRSLPKLMLDKCEVPIFLATATGALQDLASNEVGMEDDNLDDNDDFDSHDEDNSQPDSFQSDSPHSNIASSKIPPPVSTPQNDESVVTRIFGPIEASIINKSPSKAADQQQDTADVRTTLTPSVAVKSEPAPPPTEESEMMISGSSSGSRKRSGLTIHDSDDDDGKTNDGNGEPPLINSSDSDRADNEEIGGDKATSKKQKPEPSDSSSSSDDSSSSDTESDNDDDDNDSSSKKRSSSTPSKSCKSYPCPVEGCSELSYDLEAFENHKQRHGRFTCSFCSSIHDYAPDLAWHEISEHSHSDDFRKKKKFVAFRRSVHGTKRSLPCPRQNCSFHTGDKNNYIRHHLTQHLQLNMGMSSRTCPICKLVLAVNKRPGRSMRAHHIKCHNLGKIANPEDVARCPEKDCGAYFLTENQLRSHLRIVHEITKRVPCFQCHMSFSNRQALANHGRLEHPETFQFNCKVQGCFQQCSTKTGLAVHTKRFHWKGPNSLACPQCAEEFQDQFQLKAHQKRAHVALDDKKGLICEECGKGFKTRAKLQIHSLSHVGPDGWEYVCSVCSKKCMSKSNLNSHMSIHSKEKTFVCETCGAKYAHAHNLRIHAKNKHGKVMEDGRRTQTQTEKTDNSVPSSSSPSKGVKRKRGREDEGEESDDGESSGENETTI